MSVYQRFISYMYEYHGNTRHQNCGYARIDNRNNLLKLEIHMKVAPQAAEEPIHIYGCFQRDGQLYGIEFGQHIPTLGMVNWRTQCDSDHLAQTGIAFTDLEGLVLSDQSTVSYCSIWNDQSILPLDLIPYPIQTPAESDVQPASDAESAPLTAVSEGAEGTSEVLEDTSKNFDTISDTPPVASDDSGKPSDSMSTAASSSVSTAASVSEVSNTSTVSDSTVCPPESNVSTESEVSAATPVSDKTTVSDSSPVSSPVQKTSATVEDMPRVHTLVEKILAQDFVDTTSQTTTPPDTDSTPPQPTASAASARWNRLTNRFPKDTHFTDGELKNCVRVTPRELPVLRREGFHIAGNRFILHCFQRDPHCLIGKIGDSEQYIFAIPGIYDNQERFMANMFGFPCFKSETPEEPLATGQKGYWYKAIH